MDLEFRERFLTLWENYFNGAELPIGFYYTDDDTRGDLVKKPEAWTCLIGVLGKVRHGAGLRFGAESFGCAGGRRHCGFAGPLRDGFEYFLSYGIPGKIEGERYKKTPEIVRELFSGTPYHEAPAKYIVFKRWDMLDEADEPEAVIFFARPDVLSGLFTLANYDQADRYGVSSPFSAGCGTIVMHPYMEKDAANPKAVVGMFDVSARPYVPADALSFAAPMNKFVTMIDNMEESFLITKSWQRVQKRIKPA